MRTPTPQHSDRALRLSNPTAEAVSHELGREGWRRAIAAPPPLGAPGRRRGAKPQSRLHWRPGIWVGACNFPCAARRLFRKPWTRCCVGRFVGLPAVAGPRAGIRSGRGGRCQRGAWAPRRASCRVIPVLVTVRVARASISCESRRSVSIPRDRPPGLFAGSDRPGGCT